MLTFFGLLPHMCFLTLFVTSAKTFKKPLSANEEKEYLLRYKNGDVEAKNILIERNLRLVAHVVKKYSEKGAETDDLISIGTIGLIKAITTFDPDKGARLATYAAKCIDNEILMYFRSEKKRSGDISLQEPIGKDKDGNEVSLLDKLYDEDANVFDKVDLKMQVKRLYECMRKCLAKRESTVLQLRYGLCGYLPLTQNEIAKKLNISRSYVSRIEKKALEKMKDSL